MAWGQGRNKALVNQARRAIPYRCAHCASTEHLELDHITPLAEGGADRTLANVQWLCHNCHETKTKAEAARGRARHHGRRYRPAEPHPGRIAPFPDQARRASSQVRGGTG